jgi:hypothetical protein
MHIGELDRPERIVNRQATITVNPLKMKPFGGALIISRL